MLLDGVRLKFNVEDCPTNKELPLIVNKFDTLIVFTHSLIQEVQPKLFKFFYLSNLIMLSIQGAKY